ncbi:MAG: regulatory protein GemA [Paracoccaceae bacterium]
MGGAIATIHVARRLLNIDEETARDLYERVTGKRSLRAMTIYEHGAVIEEMKRQGFEPHAKKGSQRALSGRYAPVLRALWLSAWNLGVIRNRDDQALIAFVARQTQIDHLNWVKDPADAARAIEALKAWIRRESGCDELYRYIKGRPDWHNNPKLQVLDAQWDILAAAGAAPAALLGDYLGAETMARLREVHVDTIHQVQADLGKRVRALK